MVSQELKGRGTMAFVIPRGGRGRAPDIAAGVFTRMTEEVISVVISFNTIDYPTGNQAQTAVEATRGLDCRAGGMDPGRHRRRFRPSNPPDHQPAARLSGLWGGVCDQGPVEDFHMTRKPEPSELKPPAPLAGQHPHVLPVTCRSFILVNGELRPDLATAPDPAIPSDPEV